MIQTFHQIYKDIPEEKIINLGTLNENAAEFTFREPIESELPPKLKEKFDVIVERMKGEGYDFDPTHISVMVIIGYLNDIAKKGIIETAYNMTPLGRSAFAICEEFDWKPDDTDIIEFVKEIVGPKEQAAFVYLLKKYRDDREGLINDFKSVKDRAEQA